MYYLLLPLAFLFEAIDYIRNRIRDVLEKADPAKNTLSVVTFFVLQGIISLIISAVGFIGIINEYDSRVAPVLFVFLTAVVFFINGVYYEYARNWQRLISTNMIPISVFVGLITLDYMWSFVIAMLVLAILTVITTLYIVYHRKRVFSPDAFIEKDDSHEYSDHLAEDFFTCQEPFKYCSEAYYEDFSDDEPEDDSISGDNAEDTEDGESDNDTVCDNPFVDDSAIVGSCSDDDNGENGLISSDGTVKNIEDDEDDEPDNPTEKVKDSSAHLEEILERFSRNPVTEDDNFNKDDSDEKNAGDNPLEDANATSENIEDIFALFSKTPVAENDDSDDDDSDDDHSDEIPVLHSMDKTHRHSYNVGTIFTIIASALLLLNVVMCSAGIGCFVTENWFSISTVSRWKYDALKEKYDELLEENELYHFYYDYYSDKIYEEVSEEYSIPDSAQISASATDAEPEINIQMLRDRNDYISVDGGTMNKISNNTWNYLKSEDMLDVFYTFMNDEAAANGISVKFADSSDGNRLIEDRKTIAYYDSEKDTIYISKTNIYYASGRDCLYGGFKVLCEAIRYKQVQVLSRYTNTLSKSGVFDNLRVWAYYYDNIDAMNKDDALTYEILSYINNDCCSYAKAAVDYYFTALGID